MDSLILDIQRCSIHDGPGIRTTVFLKGCPLKCKWCHNPESQSFKKQVSFNVSRCTNCLSCIKECSNGAHIIKDGVHSLDFSKCNACGKCVEECSNKALKIVGNEKTVSEVVNIVKKDIAFYKSSGGGVTISGGEVLSNADFASEVLKQCKDLGINTCVETSGFGSTKSIDKIIDYVDIFLFDYKVSNDEKHMEYVGVTNVGILKNLEYIYSKNKKIILRCPIIPSVNDTEEHFKCIRELITKYPNIEKVELLPYHDFGVNKSLNIGYDKNVYETPTEEDKNKWVNYFIENNVDKVKIS